MSTPRSQRVGIWIIAIVLTIGTFGSFLAMILSVGNQKIDQQQAQNEQKQAALDWAAKAAPLEGYTSRKFDKSTTTDLKTEVLKEGEGQVLTGTESINVSYFGWTADGKLIDSSTKKGEKDAPATLSLTGVIQGWTEGLTGQKVGSVVRLTIPAAKAYGPVDTGAVPANSPLEFIVIIHKVESASS